MRSFCIRIAAVVLVILTSAAALVSETLAETNEDGGTRWGKFRIQGVLIAPLGDDRVEGWNDCGSGWIELLNFYSSINSGRAGGVRAGFEYVLKRRYGIEAGLAYWSNIVNLHFEATGITVDGSPNFIMPLIGLNYHFLTDAKKDLYAGPVSCLGVIATGLGTDIEVSKDFALGLKLGMDYYVARSWSLGANLEYIDFGDLDFSLLPPGMEGIICNNGLFGAGGLNFFSVTLGTGYRF